MNYKIKFELVNGRCTMTGEGVREIDIDSSMFYARLVALAGKTDDITLKYENGLRHRLLQEAAV